MKNTVFVMRFIFLTLFVSILSLSSTFSQTAYKLKSQKMTVSGTSSMHDWESNITTLNWKGKMKVSGTNITSVSDVMVKIPVSSIKSTKGKVMDNKTWEALKSETNPTITYNLKGGSIKPGILASKGVLTIAGVTKPVQIELKYKVSATGEIHVTGSHKINMKEYNIEPPTAVMGTIKVGETVTVNIDLTLLP